MSTKVSENRWNRIKLKVNFSAIHFPKRNLCIKCSLWEEEKFLSITAFPRKNNVKNCHACQKLGKLCDYQYFVKICYKANFNNGCKVNLFILRNWILKKENHWPPGCKSQLPWKNYGNRCFATKETVNSVSITLRMGCQKSSKCWVK